MNGFWIMILLAFANVHWSKMQLRLQPKSEVPKNKKVLVVSRVYSYEDWLRQSPIGRRVLSSFRFSNKQYNGQELDDETFNKIFQNVHRIRSQQTDPDNNQIQEGRKKQTTLTTPITQYVEDTTHFTTRTSSTTDRVTAQSTTVGSHPATDTRPFDTITTPKTLNRPFAPSIHPSIKQTQPDGQACKCAEQQETPSKSLNNADIKKEMIKKFKSRIKTPSSDEEYYELADEILKSIFKYYPQIQLPRISEKVLTNFTRMQEEEEEEEGYSGMVMEFKRENNFNILVTDPYSKVNEDGFQRVQHYPSLFQCSKAIRYCSTDPKFCQYQEGDYESNIIIIIANGGHTKPNTIQERADGCFINGQCFYERNCGEENRDRCAIETKPEKNARKMGLKLADEITNLTGARPHVVIMELHRALIDGDRNRDEGTFDEVTRSVWFDFHNFISMAKLKVKVPGLLIDFHSHVKKHGLVELSYGIDESHQQKQINMTESSFRALVTRKPKIDEQLYRGNDSLGFLLQQKHIESVPSPNYRITEESKHARKRTITKIYGSLYGGEVDAIRISIPKKYCTKSQSSSFTKLLADSIYEFIRANY